jgi:hypothetical protein
MLPLWDYRLVDYFAGLPLRCLLNKRLYINTVLSHLLREELEVIQDIARSPARDFESVRLTIADRVRLSPFWTAFRDLDLWWLGARKGVKRKAGRLQPSSVPTGPDPFDYWWMTSPDFRARVLSIFEGWDGIDGMIDTDALLRLLRDERQLPRYFLRFGIPSLLTLVFVQRVVEETTSQPAPRRLL